MRTTTHAPSKDPVENDSPPNHDAIIIARAGRWGTAGIVREVDAVPGAGRAADESGIVPDPNCCANGLAVGYSGTVRAGTVLFYTSEWVNKKAPLANASKERRMPSAGITASTWKSARFPSVTVASSNTPRAPFVTDTKLVSSGSVMLALYTLTDRPMLPVNLTGLRWFVEDEWVDGRVNE